MSFRDAMFYLTISTFYFCSNIWKQIWTKWFLYGTNTITFLYSILNLYTKKRTVERFNWCLTWWLTRKSHHRSEYLKHFSWTGLGRTIHLDNLFPSPPILPLSRLLSWWIRCFGAWFDIPLWVPLGFDTLCTLCSDISIDCWYYALQTFGSIPDQNMRCSQCSQITYPKISVFYSDYHDQAMVLDSAHLNVSLYIVHLNHF